MTQRPGRLIALLVAVIVVAIGALVTYLLLPPRQTGEVALPPATATPEEVVTTYLDALTAHDCDTARAVTTSEARAAAESWCDDVSSLSDVDVHDHLTERPRDSGHTAPDEVADVAVSFDLDWRPLHGSISMEEGPTTWGYQLVRESPDSPWRIFGQGVG